MHYLFLKVKKHFFLLYFHQKEQFPTVDVLTIQWGINKAGLENPIPFNISFKKTARIVAIPNVLSTSLIGACAQFVNDKAAVNQAILDIRAMDGTSLNNLYVQWFAIGA